MNGLIEAAPYIWQTVGFLGFLYSLHLYLAPAPKPRRRPVTKQEMQAIANGLDMQPLAQEVAQLMFDQKAATLTHQLQQAAPAVVVLAVGLEVLGELLDAGGQEGDLHLRRPGVVVVCPVVPDDLLLRFCCLRQGRSPVSFCFFRSLRFRPSIGQVSHERGKCLQAKEIVR